MCVVDCKLPRCCSLSPLARKTGGAHLRVLSTRRCASQVLSRPLLSHRHGPRDVCVPLHAEYAITLNNCAAHSSSSALPVSHSLSNRVPPIPQQPDGAPPQSRRLRHRRGHRPAPGRAWSGKSPTSGTPSLPGVRARTCTLEGEMGMSCCKLLCLLVRRDDAPTKKESRSTSCCVFLHPAAFTTGRRGALACATIFFRNNKE